MILKYNNFGKAGLKGSEIGFGGAAIGYTSGEDEDQACITCVKKAIDFGILDGGSSSSKPNKNVFANTDNNKYPRRSSALVFNSVWFNIFIS